MEQSTKQLFGIDLTDNYDSWLKVILHLASQSPSELLSTLDEIDPFQVRAFDSSLIQLELEHGRSLYSHELAQLFPCPPNGQRLTLPIQQNVTKARLFRENVLSPDINNGYFLFFQHLRKAGGTNFCSLAQQNLPEKHVPHYFCMPDWDWSQFKTAGYLHSYTNDQLIQFQQQQAWRIAGNEWEPFRSKQDAHFNLPAVFSTSFRKPLHRALSQFRFECIENRGCTIKNVTKWWEVEGHQLKNVYLTTFADVTQLYGFYRLCHEMTSQAIQQRRDLMEHAIHVLSQFHLVLIMEWLAYASPLLRDVLGFQQTQGITTRVRPHIAQAQRQGKEQNHLGAAGIQTDGASWDPREYLDSYTFKIMSEDLALDALLTDVARRMFLERTICMDTTQN